MTCDHNDCFGYCFAGRSRTVLEFRLDKKRVESELLFGDDGAFVSPSAGDYSNCTPWSSGLNPFGQRVVLPQEAFADVAQYADGVKRPYERTRDPAKQKLLELYLAWRGEVGDEIARLIEDGCEQVDPDGW